MYGVPFAELSITKVMYLHVVRTGGETIIIISHDVDALTSMHVPFLLDSGTMAAGIIQAWDVNKIPHYNQSPQHSRGGSSLIWGQVTLIK